MSLWKRTLPLLAGVVLSLFAVCMPSAANAATVVGTISGVIGSITLQLNGAETITSANGSFQFTTVLPARQMYKVTIATPPPHQSCSITRGSGLILTADITNVVVSCTPPQYRVGGSVEGLLGTVRLRLNGSSTLSLTANGSFQFSPALQDHQAYSVVMLSKPAGQQCTLANATGAVAGADIRDVTVRCTNINYSIGGSLSGLVGELGLLLNNTMPLTLSSNGSFQFPASFIAGQAYSVTLASIPVGQQCTISGSSGRIVAANISNIRISCTQLKYRVGGTVEGLNGTLRLALNGGVSLLIRASGSFQFSTQLTHGQAYTAAITAKPANQLCSITNAAISMCAVLIPMRVILSAAPSAASLAR